MIQKSLTACRSARSVVASIALHIPYRVVEILIIHRKRMKPLLPEMPSPAFSEIDTARVPSVDFAEQCGETFFKFWHYHQVHVIGHKAIGPDFDPCSRLELRNQRQIVRRQLG